MLSTFHVSSEIVTNINELLPGNHYQKIIIRIFRIFLAKFCSSGLLSFCFVFLSLSFLFILFWVVCSCSMCLYFSQVICCHLYIVFCVCWGGNNSYI